MMKYVLMNAHILFAIMYDDDTYFHFVITVTSFAHDSPSQHGGASCSNLPTLHGLSISFEGRLGL